MNEVTSQTLASDLKSVANDAEDLIEATSGMTGEKAHHARERLRATLESAKASLQRIEERAVAGAKVADRTIRDHPYESIGLSFGLGVLLGVLITRR